MKQYEKGQLVVGNVTGIEDYGIFVGIDDKYSGLIHISEISNNYVRDVNEFVKVGDKIKVQIVEKDEKNNHLKLSIKNIDYRNNKTDKNNKKKIEETGEGFLPLKTNLNKWIDEYHNN